MKDTIALSVEVPVASFRESRAKDYIASYPVPPPSSWQFVFRPKQSSCGFDRSAAEWLRRG